MASFFEILSAYEIGAAAPPTDKIARSLLLWLCNKANARANICIYSSQYNTANCEVVHTVPFVQQI
jgi:hypothetical protein